MEIPQTVGEVKNYSMYRVEKLKENVYHIDDQIDNPSSMYCIVGSQKVLWVDTANTHQEYQAELREIADTLADGKPLVVAITHNHYDHTGALDVFNDCQILFPKKDRDSKVNPRYEDIQDGDTIDLGDKIMKVVEVPGHTAGSVVFIEDQEELVISGDAIGSSYVWLFFMEDVLSYYKKGIHHLYDHIKNYKQPLFMCGHRWQQFAGANRDPLSPINDPLTMQYLLDMMELVNRIENKTASTRPFNVLGKPDEHSVYSFPGATCEIDSFTDLMK